MLEDSGKSSLGMLLLLASLGVSALLSGCGSLELAGGTSEVGNPQAALHVDRNEGDEKDALETEVTGISISTQGQPIRIIRSPRVQASDSGQTPNPVDSTTGP